RDAGRGLSCSEVSRRCWASSPSAEITGLRTPRAVASRLTPCPSSPRRPPMREDDLLKFRWIADPRISPDGTRVVFTLVRVDAEEDEYRTDLWLAVVPAPGAAPQAPRALTFDGRSLQPRWSPDGG